MEKAINQIKAAAAGLLGLLTGLWCLLAGPVIVGFDWIDHWLCGGERPRYELL